ncbi:SpoIIE family protein phosphatase [Cryptosporangium aurantiacum]|uniref:Anti-sigma regulatory factor (Ser/Thr protein kinase) n=1 Tax=Cryptosporangium aurantiacum TaxID=134849 RepID=A0A1M7IHW8_9ACTN|nr:SpoIIE family protein phosphatase [Cryptosporangium aurantiacum]SHM40198.1 Anti-sigma regulatory factor (Ser/Thr protein kinase) [Cryptosporangium aurantiacum]
MGQVGHRATVRFPHHRRVEVGDDTAVGEARRIANRLASDLGADPVGVTRAELVATELATNLLRHADPGGWLLLRAARPSRVEILAVDRGPGIPDVATALAGHSPAPKGLGCGLASARRASCLLDVYSRAGSGTVVLALVDVADAEASADPRRCAGVSVGLFEACGDGWSVIELDDGRLAVAVVDGVGHGVAASVAADVVLDVFGEAPTDLATFSRRANEAARGTRGAVATVCVLDSGAERLSCVAVGNVNGRVFAEATEKGLLTFSGGLGLTARPPSAKIQHPAWAAGATLVLWTDGLRSRLDLTGYPGLFEHDPAVVAAVLHRDHARGTDDATVVVAHDGGRPGFGHPDGP